MPKWKCVQKTIYSTIRVVHEHSVPLIGGARLWTCHHGPDSDVRAHFGWTFQPSRFLGVIGQFSDYHIQSTVLYNSADNRRHRGRHDSEGVSDKLLFFIKHIKQTLYRSADGLCRKYFWHACISRIILYTHNKDINSRCYNVCKKKKFGLMNVKMNCMFQRLFYKNSKISPLCHFK